jgi:hypothetical protein
MFIHVKPEDGPYGPKQYGVDNTCLNKGHADIRVVAYKGVFIYFLIIPNITGVGESQMEMKHIKGPTHFSIYTFVKVHIKLQCDNGAPSLLCVYN